jgi:SAM-dependent methyltransferase
MSELYGQFLFKYLGNAAEMSILDFLHGSYVHVKRVNVLSNLLATHIPQNSSVIDIGCGDGTLASSVASLRGDLHIEGVDIMVRTSADIKVLAFDGLKLPFPDQYFDVAIFVDVLHHVDEPLKLLREAGRVAKRKIIIKDHLRQGFMAQTRLSMMDWVGNARHGVFLPYRYWSRIEWCKAFVDSGLNEEVFLSKLRLYSPPLQLIFGEGLHFISVLNAESK